MHIRKEGNQIIITPSDAVEEESIARFVKHRNPGLAIDCILQDPANTSYSFAMGNLKRMHSWDAQPVKQSIDRTEFRLSLRGMPQKEVRLCLREFHEFDRFIFLGEICDGGHYALIMIRQRE